MHREISMQIVMAYNLYHPWAYLLSINPYLKPHNLKIDLYQVRFISVNREENPGDPQTTFFSLLVDKKDYHMGDFSLFQSFVEYASCSLVYT